MAPHPDPIMQAALDRIERAFPKASSRIKDPRLTDRHARYAAMGETPLADGLAGAEALLATLTSAHHSRRRTVWHLIAVRQALLAGNKPAARRALRMAGPHRRLAASAAPINSNNEIAA